jgi:ABC-type multidrug transport system permease subunit
MEKVFFSIVLVLAVIYIVPFLVYGLASVVTGLKTPEGVSPERFLIRMLVSKLGTAIAFVLIFYIARNSLSGQWVIYAVIWWLMFTIGEIGQAIGPNYSWTYAIAGIVSESAYLPLSAYLTNWLIALK